MLSKHDLAQGTNSAFYATLKPSTPRSNTMFDAEKLLGQMMGDAMSGALGTKKRKHKRKPSGLSGLLSGTSTATKAKVGLGLVGLAFAAFEHFKDKNAGASNSQPAASPPPPPQNVSRPASPPPPPAALADAPKANNENALHLIRAMIVAADADGLIDAEEKQAILGRAQEAGFDAESLHALSTEIAAPFSLKQLVARTPENLRDETYAAALIAISADTDAEKLFLDQLATGLNLDAEARQDIHQQLGL
jgi:uncharacterized membrane protein YebE (DUF533 family)